MLPYATLEGSSSCSRERGQATGSRSGPGVRLVCGLRSGAAVRKNAELVPLWVGKYDPALIACLAHVGVSSTQVQQATDLFVLLPVGWVDVEVEPVLDGLAPGHVRECQRRWHRAKAVLAFRHHRGANCDNSVVFVLHLVVKDRAPEPGETAGIGTVDRKLGELTCHVGTSQSSSGSGQGHTLIGAQRAEALQYTTDYPDQEYLRTASPPRSAFQCTLIGDQEVRALEYKSRLVTIASNVEIVS